MKGAKKGPSVPLKQKEDLNNLQKPPSQFPAFKAGGALPSVGDKENSKKPTVKFQDDIEDYDDEEEGSDFDANELLDMTDYKNKRGIPSPADIASIKPNIANAKVPAASSNFPPPS